HQRLLRSRGVTRDGGDARIFTVRVACQLLPQASVAMDDSSSTGSVGGGEEDIDLNLGFEDDDDDDATNSDTKESSSNPLGELSNGGGSVLQQGFPRGCLLSNCYLKKPKLFHSKEDLNKHLQRCMSRADKSL
ncbi:unnamed protein product, partial [Ectocarpus fasciculatus]